MKRIGILGGSFNPVHYGHVSLSRAVVSKGLADEVWLTLSPQNPFKRREDLLPDDIRLQLLSKAVAGDDQLKVCDVELNMPVPSYTIDTLHRLSQLYPENSFSIIIGADNIEKFTGWKDWQTILEEYGIIVYPRYNEKVIIPLELKPWSNRITVVEDAPLFDISSTQIRASQ